MWRGVFLWLLVRLAVMAVSFFLALASGNPLEMLRGVGPVVLLLTVVLGMIEARRTSEQVLLANLALSPFVQALWLFAAAAACEALFVLALGLL